MIENTMTSNNNIVPVITIDGPSGSGKGTVGRLLAKKLNWHFLDSGAIYRVLALYLINESKLELTDAFFKAQQAKAQQVKIQQEYRQVNQSSSDLETIYQQALSMPVVFKHEEILLNGNVVTQQIRTEKVSQMASKISSIPVVREALLERQKKFRQSPGLIADGRDMGTVVFPDAKLKIFLEASVEERAHRRYLQLLKLGESVTLSELINEVANRDSRDRNRAVAPLIPAKDAITIETTTLSIQEVVNKIHSYC